MFWKILFCAFKSPAAAALNKSLASSSLVLFFNANSILPWIIARLSGCFAATSNSLFKSVPASFAAWSQAGCGTGGAAGGAAGGCPCACAAWPTCAKLAPGAAATAAGGCLGMTAGPATWTPVPGWIGCAISGRACAASAGITPCAGKLAGIPGIGVVKLAPRACGCWYCACCWAKACACCWASCESGATGPIIGVCTNCGAICCWGCAGGTCVFTTRSWLPSPYVLIVCVRTSVSAGSSCCWPNMRCWKAAAGSVNIWPTWLILFCAAPMRWLKACPTTSPNEGSIGPLPMGLFSAAMAAISRSLRLRSSSSRGFMSGV